MKAPSGRYQALEPKAASKRLGEGSKYSRADVLKLKQVFDRHDINGNGRVTMGELLKSLEKEQSRVVDQALSAFRSLDVNKNMVLTFNEYLRRIYRFANEREFKVMLGWANPAATPSAEPLFEPNKQQLFEIQKMFDRLDEDRNGVLDIPELLVMAAQFGYDKEEIMDLFMKTDKDTSGSICFGEFVQLMRVSYI